MKEASLVIFGIFIAGVTAYGVLEKNELNKDETDLKLTSIILKPTLDPRVTSVKQKRCSYTRSSRSSNNIKPTFEQRRLEALCKYCRKSELRMKTPICRKCVENPLEITPSNIPYHLRSTLENSIDQLNTENNNLEERGSNIYPTRNDISGQYPTNYPSTSIWQENDGRGNANFNSNSNNRHITLFDNLGTTSFENMNYLTHNDYLNILKRALRSSENSQNIEIRKRNLNSDKDTQNKTKKQKSKQQLFNTYFSKHVLELSSEEDDLSEMIGLTTEKIVTESTSQETTSEAYFTTKLTTTRPKIGPKFRARFSFRNNSKDKLKSINKEWIIQNETPSKNSPDWDTILKMISSEKKDKNVVNNHANSNINSSESEESNSSESKTKIRKEFELHSTTEHSVISSEKLDTNSIPNPTNKTKIDKTIKEPPFNGIKNQYFLNKQLYRKNPRLESVYENGKHKYVLKNSTTLNWDFLNTKTTTEKSSSSSEESNSKSDEITKKLLPTKNTNLETKKITIRSTKESPTTAQKNHEITKKVLPTRHTLLHLLNTPSNEDIFHKNLNMAPSISRDKYSNIALSAKNNQNVNNIRNCHLSENKINLPLILKQNDDGTIQLILDKSEICTNCTSKFEKNISKRKTNDLTKHPMNVQNILNIQNDRPATVNLQEQINNEELLKDKFYKYLIDEQLFKLFINLNIPVESSDEIHSYIDDLEDAEKIKLKQYLLDNISKEFSIGDHFDEVLFNKKQENFVKMMFTQKNMETTTKSNRIPLRIRSSDNNQVNNFDFGNNIINSLVQNEIQRRVGNICPVCNKNSCACNNNDRYYYPVDNYSNNGRVIGKRHYIQEPNRDNSFNEGDNLIKKKYQIATNFLNWARDIAKNQN